MLVVAVVMVTVQWRDMTVSLAMIVGDEIVIVEALH